MLKLRVFMIYFTMLLITVLFGCNQKVDEIQFIDESEKLYQSQDEIISKASAIVIGEIVKTEIRDLRISLEDNEKETRKYYITVIKIKSDLKGYIKQGDTIEVIQKKDTTDDELRNTGGYFQKKDLVFLFLHRDIDQIEKYKRIYHGKELPFTLCGRTQGKYWIGSNGELDAKTKTRDFDLFKDCNNIDEIIRQVVSKL